MRSKKVKLENMIQKNQRLRENKMFERSEGRFYRMLGGRENQVGEAPEMDKFTGDQRFFIGWAQVLARKYRDEELSRRISTDPHSPSEFRANGVLRNMPEFEKAFNLKEGDKLYLKPEERVKIW